MRVFPKLAAVCAVFLLMLAGGTVAYAAPVTDGTGTTSSDSAASAAADNTASSGSQVNTPDGTGTVIASSTSGGKQFYTIQTPAGNTFYLIIDLNQQTNNVYFLDNVTEKDLEALAVKANNGTGTNTNTSSDTGTGTGTDTGNNAVAQPATSSTPAATTSKTSASGPNFSMILLVLIILGGGGAMFYFKVYKPKHRNDSRDEYEAVDDDYEAEKPDTHDEEEYDDGDYGEDQDEPENDTEPEDDT